MGKIKIYLDNCCFNRPYDDQTSETVKLETEAKLYIQNSIKKKIFELTWSFILDFENLENPFQDRKEAIEEWKTVAAEDIATKEEIRINAKNYMAKLNLKPKDALHLTCAIEAKCKFFISTDKSLVKKTANLNEITVLNPIDFLLIMEKK